MHHSDPWTHGFLKIPYDQKVQTPSFSLQRNNPIHIEFCSGNGLWIANKAKAFPHIDWIAIEKRGDRARKILKKRKANTLDNLFVVHGEGKSFASQFLDKNSIDSIFVNFPDPWPKRRHAKHRLIDAPFIERLREILKKAGSVTLVTDDQTYADAASKLFLENAHFALTPFDESNYGSSFFSDLWLSQGKKILFQRFQLTR